MWLDRNQSYVYKEFNNILRQGKPVLEMLKQLKITEKIVKIDDNYIHEQSGFVSIHCLEKSLVEKIITEKFKI